MTHYDPRDIQWLRDIEDSDTHRSPNRRIQGVVLDSIPIDASALHVDDCYALIQADIDFVNWALQEAYLVGGEFPQEALWAYYADYYRAQVSNGGHAQFVGNSGFTPIVLGNCLRGLQAIGAIDQFAILQDLIALEGVESSDDGSKSMTYELLDSRYFKADSTDLLVSKIDTWVRGLACLQPLGYEALEEALEGAKRRNRFFEVREEEMTQLRRAYEEGSALHRVTKLLCRSAGMRFLRFSAGAKLPMRMVSPSAPDRAEFCWGLLTDAGVHHVFFYKQKSSLRMRLMAEMWKHNAAEPVASCTIPQSDYAEILPQWLQSSAE
jgi:hypothetical protein